MDIFQESKIIALDLAKMGHDNLSEKIINVVSFGTIATEMLMQIRCILQEALRVIHDDTTKRRINIIIVYINKSLR